MQCSFHGDSDIQLFFKKKNIGAGEMSPEYTVLAEDPQFSSMPSHVGQFTVACNSSSRGSYMCTRNYVCLPHLPHTHNLKEKLSVKVKLKGYEIILLF